jgi:hypothetical protein
MNLGHNSLTAGFSGRGLIPCARMSQSHGAIGSFVSFQSKSSASCQIRIKRLTTRCRRPFALVPVQALVAASSVTTSEPRGTCAESGSAAPCATTVARCSALASQSSNRRLPVLITAWSASPSCRPVNSGHQRCRHPARPQWPAAGSLFNAEDRTSSPRTPMRNLPPSVTSVPASTKLRTRSLAAVAALASVHPPIVSRGRYRASLSPSRS